MKVKFKIITFMDHDKWNVYASCEYGDTATYGNFDTEEEAEEYMENKLIDKITNALRL